MKNIKKYLFFFLPTTLFLTGVLSSYVYGQSNATTPVSGTISSVTDSTASTSTSATNPINSSTSTSVRPNETTSGTSVTTDNLSTVVVSQDANKTTTTVEKSDSTSSSSEKVIKPIIQITVNPDTVVFVVKVRGADKVECYAEREGVGNPILLGAAIKIDDGLWELKKDIITQIPNGTYTGFAKIFDGDGSYRTEKIGFSINRPVAENIANSTVSQVQIQNGQNSTTENQASMEARVIANQSQSINGEVSNFENDFDRDGISNDEEKRLGTNPLQADTDQDGYLDGDELNNGFNPLRFSPGDRSDKIVFQSPKEKGQIDTKYVIENIEFKKDPEKGDTYKLSGKALPNIYLTVYIYSADPIVVIVKTDENGSWTYELDKDLENGDHEVYVAVTDNSGKITTKSNPLRFVKTAEAVTITKNIGDATLVQSPVAKSKNNALLYALIIVTLFLGISLALIGFVNSHHKEHHEGIN